MGTGHPLGDPCSVVLLRELGRTFRRQQTLQVATSRRRAPDGQCVPPYAPSSGFAHLLAVAVGARSFGTGLSPPSTAPRDGPITLVRGRRLPTPNTAEGCSAISAQTTSSWISLG